MRNSLLFLLITLFAIATASAQVKIGDNPQNIDASSVLELESTDKVLVITRITTAQMNAIVPSQGALCFNTDLQSVHYYNGTQWVNIGGGGGTGGPLSADAIVNTQPTIVITPTATGDNLEVAPNSIRSEQIVDGGVNGVDIQDGSIGPGKLQDFSITQEKLSENSVGAFALDNDSFGVSAFNNDAGYITAGDITSISADAGNAISAGSDTGAFYDDTDLLMDVMDNATAIAADDDQSATNEIQILSLVGNELTISDSNTITLPAGSVADGSETIVTAGTNVTVTGTGTTATPYVINSSGGGTPADGSETKINPTATVTVAGTGTTADPYELTAIGGGTGGTTELVDGTTLIGDGTTGDRFRINPSTTTGQFLRTTATGVEWDDLPGGTGGGNNTDFTIANDSLNIIDAGGTLSVPLSGLASASGSNNSAFDIANDSLNITDGSGTFSVPLSGLQTPNTAFEIIDDSLNLVDALNTYKIALSDIAAATGGSNNTLFNVANDSLRITDGDGTLSIALDTLAPRGIPNSIFYAGPDGVPLTVEENANPNDDRGFYWDPNGRDLGGTFQFGALFVGLETGDIQSNTAKVQIADNFPSGVAYALQVQNYSGSPTGILFSTARNNATNYGKGALVFENKAGNARGDFHFLQNNSADTTVPTLADSVITIRQTGDLALHRNLIARNGSGSSGQVLTTNATGETVWGVSAATGSINTLMEVTTDSLVVEDNSGRVGVLLTALGNAGNNNLMEVTTDSLVVQDGNSRQGVLLTALGNTGNNTLMAVTTDSLVVQDGNSRQGVLLSALGSKGINTLIQVTTDSLVVQDGNDRLGVLLSDVRHKGSVEGSIFFAGAAPTFTLSESAAQLSWDNLNSRLNIGTPFTTNNAQKLNVNGVMRTTGIKVSNGTAGVPSYRFTNNGDAGMYLADATNGELGFSTNDQEAVRIDQNQDVGIGITAPLSKLHVDGDIRAEGNFISANTMIQMPDYVFEKYFEGYSKLDETYRFKSLEEIEVFLKEKNHLPGIISAKEVKESGKWDLTKSSFNNLEKIEELFLHTIEQENKIKILKSENDTLQTQVNEMKKDLEEIKKLLKDK